MSQPDFERAKRYALERLERELSPVLVYHCLAHTQDDVLPAARRLALMTGISQDEMGLLETGAAYHDIGFLVNREGHEKAGADIAAQVLPDFGFTPTQITSIQGIIMATRLPQSPRTLLEEILADSDLDVLGREDFWFWNQALRAELAASDTPFSDEGWYSSQLKFLQSHRYFTAAARTLRAEGKQKNIEAMKDLLAQTTTG